MVGFKLHDGIDSTLDLHPSHSHLEVNSLYVEYRMNLNGGNILGADWSKIMPSIVNQMLEALDLLTRSPSLRLKCMLLSMIASCGVYIGI
jgi:hypothetical protein